MLAAVEHLIAGHQVALWPELPIRQWVPKAQGQVASQESITLWEPHRGCILSGPVLGASPLADQQGMKKGKA